MKSFLWKLALFVTLFFLIDWNFRFFENFRGLDHVAQENIRAADAFILDKTKEVTVVALGSSHSMMGINSDLIAERLNVPTYNLAFAGGIYPGYQVELLDRL